MPGSNDVQEFVDWIIQTGAIGWFGSVVIVGILLNLISNVLYKKLEAVWTNRPEKMRARRLAERTKLLRKRRNLLIDPLERQVYIASVGVLAPSMMIMLVGGLILSWTWDVGHAGVILGSDITHTASELLRGFMTLATLAGGFVWVRLLNAFLENIRGLTNFAEFERDYLRVVGHFPPGYEPVFKHETDVFD